MAIYEFKHHDTVALKVRVQRNFWSWSPRGDKRLKVNPWLETAGGLFLVKPANTCVIAVPISVQIDEKRLFTQVS